MFIDRYQHLKMQFCKGWILFDLQIQIVEIKVQWYGVWSLGLYALT